MGLRFRKDCAEGKLRTFIMEAKVAVFARCYVRGGCVGEVKGLRERERAIERTREQ